MNILSHIKIISAILGAIGVPTIGCMVTWTIRKIRVIMLDNKEREFRHNKALQILLRSDLLKMYKDAMSRQCITDDDLQLWEDEYQIYHGLGENGIMDSKRDKILQLPIVDKY